MTGLVLLHGFLGSSKNLRGLAQRWAEAAPGRYQFLLPDLRGHGEAPPLADDDTLESLGAAVLAAASAAALPGPLVLCGHSLGGRVALAAAGLDPSRIRQVILLDITPGPIDPARSDSKPVLDVLLRAPAEVPDRRTMKTFLTAEGLSSSLSDWLLMNLDGAPGRYRWRFDRQALGRLHERFTRADLWPIVEAREVPLWAIRGGRSSYLGDADADRLRANGARVDTLADAGHFVHVDALPALVDLLAEMK